MTDVIVRLKPANPAGYERKFKANDFGDIPQRAVAFNEANSFMETMSEDAYHFLKETGEPVEAIDEYGNVRDDLVAPEKEEEQTAEQKRLADLAEKVKGSVDAGDASASGDQSDDTSTDDQSNEPEGEQPTDAPKDTGTGKAKVRRT